jgi:indole-3-glycerol phosphate synthase
MEIQTWIARKRESLRTLGPLATRNLTPSIRDFAHAVTTQRGELAVVAELARATPEEGQIRRDLQIAELAGAFDAAGVSALAVATDSVLCEGFPRRYLFQSSLGTCFSALSRSIKPGSSEQTRCC